MKRKLQDKKKQWMEWLTGLFARGKELIKTVREHMAELSREQELEERKYHNFSHQEGICLPVFKTHDAKYGIQNIGK